MKVVVGLAETGHGEAIEAVALLARDHCPEIIPVSVVPPRWADPTVVRAGENEYQRALLDSAQEVLAEASARAEELGIPLAPGRVLEHRSVPEGLSQLAQSEGAELIVLGPAEVSPIGRFVAGSVADHLLHASPVPILLAPRDLPRAEGGVVRISVAYVGTDRSIEALGVAARASVRWGVPLRVVTFAPIQRSGLHARVGRLEAGAMARGFAESMTEKHREAARIAQHLGATVAETVVATGEGWSGALRGLPWQVGEILVVGSSRVGPTARVFLSSSASKILRHSPVPVLVVPRGSSDTPDIKEWRDWARD